MLRSSEPVLTPTTPISRGSRWPITTLRAYTRLDNCDLVACADIVPENAAAFADTFGIDEDRTYEDYEEMLTEVDPDVPLRLRSAGHPREGRRRQHPDRRPRRDPLREAHGPHLGRCTADGPGGLAPRRPAHVQPPAAVQAELGRSPGRHRVGRDRGARTGRDGTAEPLRLGTHALDFAGDVVGDRPAEWAIGQIDYRDEQYWFGAHNENQAFGTWEYDNGVTGVISTGKGGSLVEGTFRFVGSDGVLDLDPDDEEDVDVRWRHTGDTEWERRSVEDGEWTETDHGRHRNDVVECIGTDDEPTLGARNASTPRR